MRRRSLMLAAAAAAFARPGRAVAANGDAEIVERLIVAEQEAAFAYGRRGVTGFEQHEDQHARALRSQLSALGRAGPEPPRDPSELDGPARRVVEAGDSAVLHAEIELEASLLVAYRQALVELSEPSILRTAATIAGGHAQHHALLRRLADPEWTPDIGSRGRG